VLPKEIKHAKTVYKSLYTLNLNACHQTNVTPDSPPVLYAIRKKDILKYQKIFYSLKLDSTCHLPGKKIH
jgi:hypothetical protein